MEGEDDIQISLDVAGEDPQDDAPQYTALEEKAMSMGWRPQEEYEGDPDNWRGAKEFVDRESLYKKIHNQGRDLKRTQEALQLLAEHNQKLTTKQKEVERRRLEIDKLEALDEQDFQRASDIDGELRTLEPTEDDLLEIPQFDTQEDSELFAEFKERNSWYETDVEMSSVADGLAKAFVAKQNEAGKAFTEEDVYNNVEKKMPDHFPDYFRKTTRRQPGSLGNNSRSADTEQQSRGSTATYRNLDAQQKSICDTFVKQGILTRQQYVDQLVELGEL